ncbi:sugar ABC transporter [Paenibacillus sp. GCM10023252]|uniref:sugar ABC transporter n=1 Tax=Paenibacillus sp. GCM10023252 TaxID=3252649 RepID=UPI003615857F
MGMSSELKKKASMLVTSVLAVSLMLSACSGGNNEGGNEPGATAAPSGNGQAADPAEGPGKVYDTQVQLTAVKLLDGDVKFKEGENIDNNALDKAILEETGIQLKYLWTAATRDSYLEKLRLGLSSGEPMPDILLIDDAALRDQLIESGKYGEVGSLFDQYAFPEWKQALEESPEAWNGILKDGKRMGLPLMASKNQGDNVLWIREDWLRNLGLQAPTTMAEYEQVLEAFTKKDPDQNGKNDTFGTAIGLKDNWYDRWLGDASFVFGSYGTVPHGWAKNEQGQLYQPEYTPEFKQGLATIRGWIEKGYVPKDVGVYDEGKVQELVTSGKAGMVAGDYWLDIWPFPDLKKITPTAEFKAYPLPVGADGKTKYSTNDTTVGHYILVSNKAKHPEAAILYMNWLFKNYLFPEKGSKYEYGLVEGYDWGTVDGQPTNDKAKLGDKYIDIIRISIPKNIMLPSLWLDMIKKFNGGGKPETPMEVRQMGGENAVTLAAAKIVLDGIEKGYPQSNLAATSPVGKAEADKGGAVEKLRREVQSQILYGKAPVDSYDQFLDKANKLGYSDIVKEKNDWYASVTK